MLLFCDFVQTFVKGDTLKNEVESLMSMFRILDASRWEQEIRRRHDLFFACYGREHVKPKRHRALHFGSMIRRHGRLQVCMVHERRHKQYKEIAINVKTGQRFDLTCTELLLNRQTNLMADDLQFAKGKFAVGCRRLPADLVRHLLAGAWQGHRSVNLDGLPLSPGDISFFLADGSRAGEVKALLSKDNEFYAIVDVLSKRGDRWERLGLAVVEATDLSSPAIWAANSDGTLRLLLAGDLAWQTSAR